MNTARPLQVAGKTIVVHTVTYFIVGLLAFFVFDYTALYARPGMAALMRQTTDPLVIAGPLFQPLRGLVFALAIYPLRAIVFAKPRGWLVLWWVFVALGVVSPFGAAPGSIEGLIYTVIPVPDQLVGLVEIVFQPLLLALGLVYWVNNPDARWFGRIMTAAFVLAILLSLAGLLARSPGVERAIAAAP